MSQEKKKKVIVIGSGIAGMNVIYGLMKFNDFDITCITREKQYAYSTCGIPYVLEGVVEKFEDIILHRPEFFDEKNVKILTNTTVIDIDYTNKQVKTFSKEGKVDQLEFDFLVIATGRVPFTPEIKGTGLKRIYTLMNYSNGVMLKEAMTQCEKAVIVGAGLIGLEAAVAFAANNIKTTVVELTPSVLPAMLDLDMGIIVEEWLRNKGIEIITGVKVKEFDGTDQVKSVILESDKEIPTDLVLLAVGIRPNVSIIKKTGIDIGKTGGIKVDERLHILKNNRPIENVFALGDCIETKNLITEKPMRSALASTAIMQSKTIVKNIIGKKSEYLGTISPSVTYLGGLEVGSVGLTEYAAKSFGISYKVSTSEGASQSKYIPDWKNLKFKFLARNNKLIGAQIIGEKDVKERINELTIVIREKIPIGSLLKTERCYTPPLTLLNDPMLNALEKLT